MAHYNGDYIEFFGNLTRDPESSTTQNGNEQTRFSVAANHRVWNSEEGAMVDSTTFYDCRSFGVIGKRIYESMRKGDFIWVAGNMTFREYTRRDGTPGYAHDVFVSDAHTNIQLVRRETHSSSSDDSDRRDRGSTGDDRDRYREQERRAQERRRNDRDDDRDKDRDDDRDSHRRNSRDDDRDDDRDNDRRSERGGRSSDDDRDPAPRSRERNNRDDDRRNSRNEDRDPAPRDRDRYGDWNNDDDSDDLPF